MGMETKSLFWLGAGLAVGLIFGLILGILATQAEFLKAENRKLHEDIKAQFSITNVYKEGPKK
jgi:hypothetical protein